MQRTNSIWLAILLLGCCGIILLQLLPIGIPPGSANTKFNVAFIVALAVSLIASCFACWLIIRYENLHFHFSVDHIATGPQKFHGIPTPRIGGLALAVGILAGEAVLFILLPGTGLRPHGFLLLAALPAFIGGLTEDVTKRVGVTERLLATMLSAAIAAWLLDVKLLRVDIPIVDSLLSLPPISLFMTLVAVGGVANSINIIDGYNGLAGGISVLCLAAIAFVAHAEGNYLVLSMALPVLGGCVGFMLWNWPNGKVFLGDGGAYLLGFLLAELSLTLVIQRPRISPWFPFVLLIHPIFETLFSVYRRKFVHRNPTSHPDANHLHQLIYKRIVRIRKDGDIENWKLRKNNRVAPYIWGPVALTNLLAILFYSNTLVLISVSFAYAIFYWHSYRMIVLWRIPDRLISH